MGFSENTAIDALVKCARHCCICHKFCGVRIELHHIKQKADNGEDSIDNCIPLCLDCHAEVKSYNPRHPKGKAYSEIELIRHRNNWFAKVEKGNNAPSNINEKHADNDTYVKFIQLLSYDSFLFIKEYDFGGIIQASYLSAFKDYLYNSDNPDGEFYDPDIEGARANLVSSIRKLIYLIAVNTSWDDDPSIVRIPENIRDNNLIVANKARQEMNDAADDVWGKYCDFVKLAKLSFIGI